MAKKKAGEVKGGGATLHGINGQTARKNRRYSPNSGYHLLPMCPQRGTLGTNSVPVASSPWKPTRPPYASISIKSAAEAQDGVSPRKSALREHVKNPSPPR